MITFHEYTLSSGPNTGQTRPFLPIVDLGDGYVGGILFASPDADGLPATSYVVTREGTAPGEVQQSSGPAERTDYVTSDQGHFAVHTPASAPAGGAPPVGTDSGIPDPPAPNTAEGDTVAALERQQAEKKTKRGTD